MHRSFPLALLSLMLLSVVPACGDPATPEAKLEAAGDALDDARDDTHAARESLADAKERLAAAETELRDARKAMRAAEKRVLSARARVDRRATDVALFRKIQARLLEADSLLQDAVTARVDDGNVTLEGTVAHDAARKTALQIARSTPGVSTVRDHLDVESDEAS